MNKWEYKFFLAADLESKGFFSTGPNKEDVEVYLNELGTEGWEIISVDFTDTSSFIDFRGVAKRPK